MYYIKLIFTIGMLSLTLVSISQADCQNDMDKANKLFDDGRYREASKITKMILETCSLNSSQENEMLKLMASICYEMDELELGDEYMAEFIKKNPHYISSKRTDTQLFRSAIDKIKSFPRFSVGLKAGLTTGTVTTTKIFPILDAADYLEPYSVKPGFQGGIELTWNLFGFLSLNTGTGLRIQNLQQQVSQYDQLFFHYKEQNISSTFPVSIGFSVPITKTFAAQAYVGGELELAFQSKYSYDYTGTENISDKLAVYLKQKKNKIKISKDERAKYRYAAMGGLKLSYKLEKLSLFADFRYVREMVLYNNPQNRFLDTDLYLNNNYVLSDIELENLDFSIGLMFNFSYKVKSKY